jgi:hypothetical protein
MSKPKTFRKNNFEYRSDIFEACKDRISSMADRHCKVFCHSFNFQLPQTYQSDGGNKEISKISNIVKNDLRKRNIDTEYVWVREQNESENPHYHFMLIVDGSKINNSWSLKSSVDTAINKTLKIDASGLQHINNPDNDHRKAMINRPSPKATGEKLSEQQSRFDYAMEQTLNVARYMSKTDTKGAAPAHVREFQGSQIKKIIKNKE